MPRYRYTGDFPVVFAGIQNPNGSTWAPRAGDEIDTHPVSHPLLVEVQPPKPVKPEPASASDPEED